MRRGAWVAMSVGCQTSGSSNEDGEETKDCIRAAETSTEDTKDWKTLSVVELTQFR